MAARCAYPITWIVSPIIWIARGATSTIIPFVTSAANTFSTFKIEKIYTSDVTVKDMAPNSSYINSMKGCVNVPIYEGYDGCIANSQSKITADKEELKLLSEVYLFIDE